MATYKMANEDNLRSLGDRPEDERKAIARAGGLASGESKKRRKAIREALQDILSERVSASSELTKQEAIIARVVKRLNDEGDIRDLKVLQDILGEVETEKSNSITIYKVSQEVAEKMKVLSDTDI